MDTNRDAPLRHDIAQLTGTLHHPNGAPIPGLTIRAYHVSLSGKTELGHGRTDERGQYAIQFKPISANTDLLITAFDAKGDRLAASPIRFNAAAEERIDLTIDAPRYRGPSEFQRLHDALDPLLRGVDPKDLGAEQVAYLAGKTGIAPARVNHYLVAERLSRQSGLPHEALYGLLREGFGPSLDRLLARAPSRLGPAIERAAADNVVSLDIGARAGEIRGQAVRALIARRASDETPGSVGRILAAAGIEAPDREAFIAQYVERAGAPREKKTLGAQTIERIELALGIAAITADHAPMVAAVLEHVKPRSTRDLARLTKDDWKALAQKAGVPEGVAGATPAERLDNYAALAVAGAEIEHPTAAVLRDLAIKASPDLAPVVAFLDKNPSFDFESTPVTTYLEGADLTGVPDRKALSANLSALQRLYRISPATERADAMLALRDGGFSSAQAVERVGRNAFVTRFARALGGEERARSIYDQARAQAAVALTVYGKYAPSLQKPAISAIPARLGGAARATGRAAMPDVHALFGSQDYCRCEACGSILGPAAYFVDLLQWLAGRTARVNGKETTALKALLARRPDLGRLELSCDNTNTTLPYVDLVNEILENAVAGARDEAKVAHRATTASADDLLANPQYLNPAAYDVLASALHPLTLPFDLWASQARLYLAHLGISRADLMAAFQRASGPSDLAIASERLGLTTGQRELITGPPGRVEMRLWGFGEGAESAWLAALRPARGFLARAGITFTDLLDLLNTTFVNQGGVILLVSTGESACDVAQMTLQKTSDGVAFIDLGEADFNRIRRFLRLWRALGLTMLEVDKILAALGVTTIDDEAIQRLAAIARIQAMVRIGLLDLISFWGPIDTKLDRPTAERPVVSLYDRVFLDPSVVADPETSPFRLTKARTAVHTSKKLAKCQVELQAALHVNADDLAAALAEVGSKDVTLETLSHLYRIVALARAIGASVTDALRYRALFGPGRDPFASPAEAVAFFEALKDAQASGFSIDQLAWLLRDDAAAARVAAPSDDALALTLSEIRYGLQAIRKAAVDAEGHRTPDVIQAQSESLVKQTLATALGIGLDAAEDLLVNRVKSPRDPAVSALSVFLHDTKELHEDAWRTLLRLHKIALVLSRLSIAFDEQRWLFDADVFDLAALPVRHEDAKIAYASWRAFTDLLSLRKRIPGSNPGFVELMQALSSAAHRKAALETLAERTGWSFADIRYLADALGLTAPAQLGDGVILRRMVECFAILGRAGVSAEQADGWRVAKVDETMAGEVLLAARARYDAAGWRAVARPLRDDLRERQRKALVDWLLAHGDATDLYGRYLIDVEMSPCQLTSRIKQAIASVQLYVQRAILGLENVDLDEQAISEWKTWRKSYRLWEAARKVFLYPENWIEPSLRDDKSPFFEELESALRQQDVTDDNVEAAYLDYLEKLAEVARLDIRGMYYEQESDAAGSVDVLHVFGRTRALPHVYYYRRWEDRARWTAWEKVDVDVQGEHLIPVVHDRRLMLFWATFRQAPDEVEGTGNGQPATYHWEIHLSFSEYVQGAWSPVRQIETFLVTDSGSAPATPPKERYYFRTSENEKRRLVIACRYVLPDGLHEVGSFVLNERDLGVSTTVAADSVELLWPNLDEGSVCGMAFAAPAGEALSLPTGSEGDVLVLGRMPADSLVVVPHQYDQFVSQAPFFVADDHRTFFVVPAHRDRQLRESPTPPTRPAALARSSGPSGPDERMIEAELTYRFSPFYHPFAPTFIRELRRFGLPGLLAPKQVGGNPRLDRQRLSGPPFFRQAYDPLFEGVANPPPPAARYVDDDAHPMEDIDFTYGGAYSLYNWEVFFHAPLLIATSLTRNQRFDEARRWYELIFDPTCRDKAVSVPMRYWKVKPLMTWPDESIDDLLAGATGDARAELEAQTAAWSRDPYNPFAIARLRPSAFQRMVVMRYLDNLIAWGDQLFRRDTIEAINEATQLYLLAWQILGDRPEEVPPIGEPEVQTYNGLQSSLDGLSDALVEIENYTGTAAVGMGARIADSLPSLGQTLYFGVPPNDKLLSYWDTVADRLFKIRHCMNIEGLARQLPLFEPPIDPALLVAASAAGVDIQSALTDLNAPLPQYRFSVMVQKAKELCGTVKALGAALLSALERRDAGALELLRSGHEIAVLQAMYDAKKQAIEEAKATLAGLQKSKEAAEARQAYYQRLIDAGRLTEEQAQLEYIGEAGFYQAASQLTRLMGAAAAQTPDATAGTAGPTASPVVTMTLGGSAARAALEMAAGALDVLASASRSEAECVGIIAGHIRRAQEWEQQLALATKDMEALGQQITAANIRVTIAERDLTSHELQMANAKEVEAFLRTRFTSQELYDWMADQISTLHFQSYQLAYDVAKRAERCYRHELGLPGASFIQLGSWDSLRKGLLEGERLQADLDRMDASYLDNDRREYEIHKDISLALLDPAALVQLRQTGRCSFALPEAIFDLDYPGHYLRRIKSVSFTIPCVAGPFAGVGMTVTLTDSSVRTSDGGGATRLVEESGAAESIVTSRGEQDGGVFELSHQDARYLPFERRGAISRWQLALAGALPQFDPQTITDVVMHLRYTARGDEALKNDVKKRLGEAINAVVSEAGGKGPALGISAANDEADAWYQFLHPADATADPALVIDLRKARFPYPFQQATIEVTEVQVILLLADPAAYGEAKLPLQLSMGGAESVSMKRTPERSDAWGGQPAAVFSKVSTTMPGTLTLTAARADLAKLAPGLTNLLLIARYTVEVPEGAWRGGLP